MDGKQLTDPVYSQCDLVYVNVLVLQWRLNRKERRVGTKIFVRLE